MGDLSKARSALHADEPYVALKLATANMPPLDAASTEQLEIVVAALDSICSDLDEHGEANLSEYGGGLTPMEAFYRLRDEARAALARRASKLAKPELEVPSSPRSVRLGQPELVRDGSNPKPIVIGECFLSQEGTTVVLRSLSDGAVVHSCGVDNLTRAALSPDGHRVALGLMDGTVHVFDAAGTRLLQVAKVATDWVTALAFSSDGERLAVGTRGLAVVDARSGDHLAVRVFEGRSLLGKPVQAVTFSPDGTQLWLTQPGSFAVLDVGSLDTVLERAFEGVETELLTVDARHVLTALWGKLALLDVKTGLPSMETEVKHHASRFALDRRGGLAATLSRSDAGTQVTLFSLNPLQPLASVEISDREADANATGGVVFGSGHLVVSTSAKTVRIPCTTT